MTWKELKKDFKKVLNKFSNKELVDSLKAYIKKK